MKMKNNLTHKELKYLIQLLAAVLNEDFYYFDEKKTKRIIKKVKRQLETKSK
jgi:hypothetical protein